MAKVKIKYLAIKISKDIIVKTKIGISNNNNHTKIKCNNHNNTKIIIIKIIIKINIQYHINKITILKIQVVKFKGNKNIKNIKSL